MVKDLKNPFRRVLLIKALSGIDTDDMILAHRMQAHLTNLIDIHGTSIINATRRKEDRVEHIIADKDSKDSSGSVAGSHIMTLPDGTEVEVLPNTGE